MYKVLRKMSKHNKHQNMFASLFFFFFFHVWLLWWWPGRGRSLGFTKNKFSQISKTEGRTKKKIENICRTVTIISFVEFNLVEHNSDTEDRRWGVKNC